MAKKIKLSKEDLKKVVDMRVSKETESLNKQIKVLKDKFDENILKELDIELEGKDDEVDTVDSAKELHDLLFDVKDGKDE